MTEPTPTNGSAAAPSVELAAMALDDEKKNGSNGAAAAGAASPSPSAPGLKDQFTAFSKFGDCKSDGKQITLSQSDKWMKQAKVIDKQITTTDTGIHFKKFKSLKIGFGDYKKFIEDLAKTKNVPMGEIVNKLSTCGTPGINQINAGKATAAVSRLTDPSKYTGSHKERFDETGKGKGIAGRKDMVDGSGYVSGYQHKNTYDKTH